MPPVHNLEWDFGVERWKRDSAWVYLRRGSVTSASLRSQDVTGQVAAFGWVCLKNEKTNISLLRFFVRESRVG